MTTITYSEMFPLSDDQTPYRKISSDHVSTQPFNGSDIVTIEPAALSLLTETAFHDISHFLRPGHLQQLAKIIADPEASNNDRFVAIEFLKNANIAAGGVLPMCQDTGTAIIMGKKGERVFTGGDDERAISMGVAAHAACPTSVRARRPLAN